MEFNEPEEYTRIRRGYVRSSDLAFPVGWTIQAELSASGAMAFGPNAAIQLNHGPSYGGTSGFQI
ncbi:MAG: hypothetical protein QGG25_09525, partial [Phycisphaerae bacterium]|nr:hypothetical protein [Phycisphaerae bacterium]